MKNSRKIILTVLTTFLFILPAVAQNIDFDKSINTVISNYISLKNALASGDGNAASAKAKTLLASVNALTKTKLSNDEVNLIGKLEYDSRHISEVQRVAHQREHFASLSNNIYILIKKTKANQVTLYRQYCTMDKQYYPSESAQDTDPYMGMNNCSKVVETLPAQVK